MERGRTPYRPAINREPKTSWVAAIYAHKYVRASERPRDCLVSTCLVPRFIYYRFDVSTSKGYRSTRRNPNSCRHSETRVFRRAIAWRCLKKFRVSITVLADNTKRYLSDYQRRNDSIRLKTWRLPFRFYQIRTRRQGEKKDREKKEREKMNNIKPVTT